MWCCFPRLRTSHSTPYETTTPRIRSDDDSPKHKMSRQDSIRPDFQVTEQSWVLRYSLTEYRRRFLLSLLHWTLSRYIRKVVEDNTLLVSRKEVLSLFDVQWSCGTTLTKGCLQTISTKTCTGNNLILSKEDMDLKISNHLQFYTGHTKHR